MSGTSPGCRRPSACSSDQTVVFGVSADPVPDDAIFLHDRQSAIFKTDANQIDVILAFQFLELQNRGAPDCSGRDDRRAWRPVGRRRVDLKTNAELPGRPGLNQSRSSNGRVLPLSSSSRASRAIRRITSRFSAKRFFQASSSASEARIWDAISHPAHPGAVRRLFPAPSPTASRCFNSILSADTGEPLCHAPKRSAFSMNEMPTQPSG